MPAADPLDHYLDRVRQVRTLRAGTAETSYYPALAAVLDLAGAALRPRVVCLHHPSGAAGIPDFGLFEQAQFRRGDSPEWTAAVAPERGVVEAKGASHPIETLVCGEQVARYRREYGLVLATNLRQFRLVRADGAVAEGFDLAPDEAGFWALVHGSRDGAAFESLRARFADFLQRCLLHRAPLAKPSDVAFFLASYARDALARLAERADLPALRALRDGMETALGVTFDARDGERLFRSTLVQTLFYGLFSAWVVEARDGRAGFDWRAAQWSLHVPVARFLFQQVATPEALEPLDLVPLLDAAGATLNRVDRAAFFAAFDDAQAVQYFYEPFLEYFDPRLRRDLGVWYTPPEIVTYMVERVDRVLRTELGIADGLADPNVWVLDPCCGTGSYVVAVLDRIRRTLEGRGLGDLLAERLREAANRRVVGFEIMTAPFVIAHWQVGEALRRAGAPLTRRERAAVFLTNALTGWDAAGQPGVQPAFAALAAERSAAGAVKQEQPILVVLGNPPYNAYAGVSPAAEGGLVEPYKAGLQDRWGVRKFNLDDLYVRFFRIAERRIAERTGKGVVCYISNLSYLAGGSFATMRERLVSGFDAVWVDCLNGDSRETGKLTPDGEPDPSVFSTAFNREGIRVGTAIGLFVRSGNGSPPRALFRQFWGRRKREELAASLDVPDFDAQYETLRPSPANRYALRPGTATATFDAWPTVESLSRTPDWSGVLEKRRGTLMGSDPDELRERMRDYCDPANSFAQLLARNVGPVQDAAAFNAAKARGALVQAGGVTAGRIARIALYPFDLRWCFHTNVQPIWNRSRPEVAAQQAAGNLFFVTRVRARQPAEGFPAFATAALPGDHLLDPNSHPFPFVLHQNGSAARDLFVGAGATVANLSDAAAEWLASLGLSGNAESSRLVWRHVLATTYSPAYLAANAAGIRQGWPRIPLPGDAEALRRSAALGARLAALLDPDTPVPGVTEGEPLPALRAIAVPTTRAGQARDWRLLGWGNRTDKGVTMPGRGRLETRDHATDEAGTAAHAATLGARVHDVGLNGATYWRCVPDAVWECRIGGYQVLKKWLSYRDHGITDRPLDADEIAHVQATARRLAAILLLGPELDEAHAACAAAHRPSGGQDAASAPPLAGGGGPHEVRG